MPYSDPEKKRAYMAKYNPKYYGENREPLIRKNINRKKELRAKKRDFILNRYENACPHCGSMEVHPIKLYLEYRMEEPPTKPMMDLSWPQLELLLNNGFIDVVCSTCKFRGKPADHIGS